MIYLIDANILISAHRTTHPLDIHPTFWNKLKIILNRDDVLSIDKVKDEIFYFEDKLSIWCKENINKKFWSSTYDSINEYGQIQSWAHSNDYKENALREFANLKNADPFLVSYSLHQKNIKDQDVTIVTLEESAPESKKNIKLPEVCNQFNIPYINNNEFYRALQITF